MTQREKTMAGIVGLAAGVYFGYLAIQNLIIEPDQRIRRDIANELEYRDKLLIRLNASGRMTEDWYAQTGRTLSESVFDAHQDFRNDVNALLERNHLTDGIRITKYKERMEKKWPRNGFVELPVSVRVNGTLSDLNNFLRDFFQRPYFVRMEKLDLLADHSTTARGKRDGKADGEPKLSINMMVSTLVLPTQAGREHPRFDLARLNEPDSGEELPVVFADRLRHQPEDYMDITANSLFVKWSPPPPPPPPPPVVRETPKPVERQPAPVQPPPPPPPTNDHLVVQGVGRLEDGPIVYVADNKSPGTPPAEYRLNQQLDGGRLVLIVPEGIVIQVPPKAGQRAPVKNYFYPLGQSFAERAEVDPTEHPTIARYLEIVLKQPG